MISLRPHKYQIAEPFDAQQANNGLDSNGYVIGVSEDQEQDDPEWGEEIECRYETNGRNNVRPAAGGTFHIFRFVVYCSPLTTNLMGKRIRLLDELGQTVYTGMIDDQSNRQLSTVFYIK